jgi:hypothetical protein
MDERTRVFLQVRARESSFGSVVVAFQEQNRKRAGRSFLSGVPLETFRNFNTSPYKEISVETVGDVNFLVTHLKFGTARSCFLREVPREVEGSHGYKIGIGAKGRPNKLE